MISQTELIKQAFNELMKNVGTSIPGHVVAFDPKTQTAQVQIGIKRVEVGGKQVDIPPLIQSPVHIYGGDFAVEIEIKKGDEGLIIFSQRCIDEWLNSGGVANNPIVRFHDFSDSLFIPGFRSNPSALHDFENNGIRLRNKAGDNYIWLKNDGAIELKGASLDIDVTGDINIKGKDLDFDVDEFTHGGTDIGITHRHDGVDPGVGNTGEPI